MRIEHGVRRDLEKAGCAHHGFALFYILFLEVGEVCSIQIGERDVTQSLSRRRF